MEFQKYNVKEKKKEKQKKTQKKAQKIIKNIYMKFAEEEKNRVFFLQSKYIFTYEKVHIYIKVLKTHL